MTSMPVEASRATLSASVVLDSNGNGQIRMAPLDKKWQIDSSNVLCSLLPGQTMPVKEALCRVYVGQVAALNQVDGTYSGSSGDTSDTVMYLTQGQAVFFVWTGGDVGVTATVQIGFWQSVPAGGFRAVH